MGREAEAWVTFDGQSGTAKLLLESDHLLMRGEVRGRFSRTDLSGFEVQEDWLQIATPIGPLRANLGAKLAAAWAKALAKPPPSLAQKLGVSPETPARLLGRLSDPALLAACEGATSPDAALGLIELTSAEAVQSLLAWADLVALSALWCVTLKGKSAPFPEALLRDRMRGLGWIDTKSCAVSAEFSATRYNRRKDAAV